MPLTQQITANVALLYDAPSPVGVFDDFMAIQPAKGNVSTLSYSDHVIGAHSLTASPPTRLVIRDPVGGMETDKIPNP